MKLAMSGGWKCRCVLFATVGVLTTLATAAAGLGPGTGADLRNYYSGNGLLNRGLYDLAAAEYRRFLEDHDDDEKASTARYGLGYSLFRLGRYQMAALELEQLQGDAGFEFAAEAALVLGQCRMALQDYEHAVESFDWLLVNLPDHKLVDDALALQTEAYYRGGRYEDVAKPASTLVADFRNSPHRERAELFWGLSDMARGDDAAAVERFEGMTHRFPTGTYADQTSLLLAQSLHRTANVERAEQQYQDAITRNSDAYTPDALYGMALLLQQQDHADRAGFFLDQLLERYPRDELVPAAHLLRGRVFFDLGNYDEAAGHFGILDQQEGPFQAEAAYWVAKCDLRQNKPAHAAKRLAQAIRQFPDSTLMPEMVYDLAVAMLHADQATEALAVLADLRKKFPGHDLAADALHLIAMTTHQLQRYEESRAACESFLEQYPGHTLGASMSFLAGENDFLRRDYAAAEQSYQRYLHDHPRDSAVDKGRFRLGMALDQLGRFEEAVPALAAVVGGAQTRPEFRAALLALGDGYFQREDWVQAERHLADYTAFGLDQPAADNALLKLGLSRQRQERPEEAIDTYDALLAHFDGGPHRRQAIFERGQALVSLGRTDEAEQAFTHLIEDEPDERFKVHALNHLGTLAMRRGDFEQAATSFGRVVEAHPAPDVAAEALYQQGQALMSAARFEPAAAAFGRIVEHHRVHPRRAAAAALQAIATARAGRSADALALVAQVEEHNLAEVEAPLVAAMTYEKAWAQRDLGRPDEAAETYRALLALPGATPLRPSAILELAELHFDGERYQASVDLLRPLCDALVGDENAPPGLHERALYRLGISAYRLEHFEEAAQRLESFLDTYPDSDRVPSASLFCGQALVKAGRHARAVDHFRMVAEKFHDDPACEPSLLQLGESLAVLQDFPGSEQAFREHRRRYPDSSQWFQSQFGIGWALENQGSQEPAIAAYREVVDGHQGPTAARAQFQIGECLFALERYKEAARELLKVDILYAYPEWSAAALYETGRCLQALANPVGARQQYEKLVQDHPDTEWAVLARQRLDELSRSRLPGH